MKISHNHNFNHFFLQQIKSRIRFQVSQVVFTEVAMAVWETVFFTVFSCFSLVVGSCANFLVIVSSLLFISFRDIQGTSLFLVSLSVADFLICAVYQPLLVIRFNHPDQNQTYLVIMRFFGYSLMTASLNGLLAVSFDRFVAIYLPFKYVTWMKESNVSLLILISWLVALAIGILNLSDNVGVTVTAQLYTIIVIVIIPILYGAIYKEARKQARRIIDQSLPATVVFPNRHRATDNKATKGVGLVLITTLICWLPVIMTPLLTAALKSDEDILRAVLWFLAAACVNSCINPFIYFYKFSKFRRNVRKLFQKIRKRWRQFFGQDQQAQRQNQPKASRCVVGSMDVATTARS